MESGDNYNISLGFMSPRQKQKQDKTGTLRWIVIRLSSRTEKIPFFITPSSGPRVNMDRQPAGASRLTHISCRIVLSTKYRCICVLNLLYKFPQNYRISLKDKEFKFIRGIKHFIKENKDWKPFNINQ